MKQISVLIIEDCIYAADLNVRMIRKSGFDVEFQIVGSSDVLQEALQNKRWDLILSDNSMAGFSALQALEIRNRVDGSIPFVIVSEQISEEEIVKAKEVGCSALILKENLPELRELAKVMLNNDEKNIP